MAEEFEAGWIGGLAQVALGHPLDTIKVRLQAQNMRQISYRGTFHCVSSIVRQESALGLCKGMLSPMLTITTLNAIAFGVRGNVLRLHDSPTLLDHCVAGGLAGAAQLPLSCPAELVKTRMQMSGVGEGTTIRGYTGSLRTLMGIYRSDGLVGCYRGVLITAMRDTPAFAIYFSFYEIIRRKLERRNTHGVITECLAGGTGGALSWALLYPIDVIKSRLQADGVGGVVRYTGIRDAVIQCVRNDSFASIHAGIGVAMVRAFVVNAFVFTVFAYSRKLLVKEGM